MQGGDMVNWAPSGVLDLVRACRYSALLTVETGAMACVCVIGNLQQLDLCLPRRQYLPPPPKTVGCKVLYAQT